MPIKVLIVEDNPVARSFLSRVVRESFSDALLISEASDLDTARRELAASSDGTPGRRATADDAFKLVLVDLELPDGNAMALLAELREYPATKIVTTLYSDDDHLFPALQRGADGYLLKEDRFEVLVEELQKLVRGQLPLSPAIARRLLAYFRQGRSEGGPPRDSGAMPLGGLSPNGVPEAARGLSPRGSALSEQRLSPRETEVLTYLAKGFTIKEIATLMGIKWFAVNDHIKSIYKKLDDSSRAEAAILAGLQGAV